MHIIEMYGCPGTGKTTVAGETIRELKGKGITCLSFNELYDPYGRGKAGKALLYLSALCCLPQLPLNVHILRTGLRQNCRLRYMLYLAALCRQIRRFESVKSADAALLDEGVIQFATSLFHGSRDCDREIRSMMCRIRKYGICVLPVRCVLPLEENKARLLARGEDKRTRFLEAGSDQELAELLTEKQRQLDVAAKAFRPFARLDMRKDPAANAQGLSHKIEALLRSVPGEEDLQ